TRMSSQPHRRPPRGFTLAELLIIVALIAILAAIVLPNVLRSQISANEASAVADIAIINRAEVSYQTAYPTLGFAGSLETLGPNGSSEQCQAPASSHACLIPGGLAEATSAEHARNGYWFAASATGKDANGVVSAYVAGAAAAVYNKTGVRDFCSQEDAV